MAAEQPKTTRDLQKEFEIHLNELEERVDRLRSLYEQYFMGYEKLEPGVARKDVDRRFVVLRKMQVRNTALRFRFNVVTQKFNTYAMYWTRICRQIEEGTYKRHIAKAAKRFGADAVENLGANAKARAPEDSIEVEIGDFEEIDMDAVLAEADAAAEAYVHRVADTDPPPALNPVPRRSERPTAASKLADTSFALGGFGEPLPDFHSEPPPPPAPTREGQRTARHAATPADGKPRVQLRKYAPDGAAPPAPPALGGLATPIMPFTPVSNREPLRGPMPVGPPVPPDPDSPRQAPVPGRAGPNIRPIATPLGPGIRPIQTPPGAGIRPIPTGPALRPMATPPSPMNPAAAPRAAPQVRPAPPRDERPPPSHRHPLQMPPTATSPMNPVRPRIALRTPAAPMSPVKLPSANRGDGAVRPRAPSDDEDDDATGRRPPVK